MLFTYWESVNLKAQLEKASAQQFWLAGMQLRLRVSPSEHLHMEGKQHLLRKCFPKWDTQNFPPPLTLQTSRGSGSLEHSWEGALFVPLKKVDFQRVLAC